MDNLENRLEYITNMYEKQIQGLKTGLITGLQNMMEMELQGLTAFANTLPPERAEVLRMYIVNIQQVMHSSLKA